jgi:hypothetical protein
MHLVLHERKVTNDTLVKGLLLGLWAGEVLAAAEYWLLKAGSVGLGALSGLLRRPALIVLAAVVGYAGGVGAGMLAREKAARVRTALLDAKAISYGAEMYRVETGRWPSTLESLVPQYLKDLHADPWGRNYALYRGEGGIAIVSGGPDRDLGSPDDVLYVVPNP